MSYLFNLEIHLLRLILCYCSSIYKKYIIVSCFICNHHRTLIISKNLNQVLHDIFNQTVLLQTSKSTTSQNLGYTTHRKHWNTDLYCGLVDCGEGDLDSDLNRLASVIVRQYNTVTNQCKWLPWTWTWRIWYWDSWSHFDNCSDWV